MDEVTVAHVELAQVWVRRAAHAYNLRVDRARIAAGKPDKEQDGRGASAWFVRTARWLWGRAIDDGVVPRDVSQKLRKPEAIDGLPRSLSPEQVMEAIEVAGSTAEDPHLGGLVALSYFATGARRGGLVTTLFGRLNVDEATVVVAEPKRQGLRPAAVAPAHRRVRRGRLLPASHRAAHHRADSD